MWIILCIPEYPNIDCGTVFSALIAFRRPGSSIGRASVFGSEVPGSNPGLAGVAGSFDLAVLPRVLLVDSLSD